MKCGFLKSRENNGETTAKHRTAQIVRYERSDDLASFCMLTELSEGFPHLAPNARQVFVMGSRLLKRATSFFHPLLHNIPVVILPNFHRR